MISPRGTLKLMSLTAVTPANTLTRRDTSMAGCAGGSDMGALPGNAALAALLDRHLAGAESSRLAVLAAQEKRAHVVHAEHPPAPPAAADGKGDLAPPQHVVAVPERHERVDVLAVGEALVGEEDAAHEGGRQPVQVDGSARELRERHRPPAQVGRPPVRGAVHVEPESEHEVANLVGVHARLGEHPAGLAAVEDDVVRPLDPGRD